MSRIARRIRQASIGGEARFDPDQHYLETALRGRTARKARAHLRRMEPVVVLNPRWGAASEFLEGLSLDLAVGEPAIGCRTVNLGTLKGRSVGESWQMLLRVFGQLGRRGWQHGHPLTVADRRGFRFAIGELLEDAHRVAPHRVALLAHGAEHLPVEVIEDLTATWASYVERHPEGARCTILLVGSIAAPWLRLGDSPVLDLSDYGEAEAAAAIVGRAGPLPIRQLESAARFSGGIPGLVGAIGDAARSTGRLPRSRDELLSSMGGLGDQVRGAVDIVAAHGELSDRLHTLRDSAPRDELDGVDHPLIMAGLVRRLRGGTAPMVVLRAPAIAQLLG